MKTPVEETGQPSKVIRIDAEPARQEPPAAELAGPTRQAFEDYLDRLRKTLPGYLYTSLSTGPVESRLQPVRDALAGAGEACAALLEMAPFPGCAYLVLGSGFACPALDVILGAPTDLVEPRQSLTEVDLVVLRDLVELMASELGLACQPVIGASFRMSQLGWAAKMASGASASETALVLSAEVTLRGRQDWLRMIVPSFVTRLFSQTGQSIERQPEEPQPDPLLDGLGLASFQLEAVLRGADIRLRDLTALRPGLVLELPHKTEAPLECQVNGIPKFQGILVSHAGGISFQIDGIPNPMERS